LKKKKKKGDGLRPGGGRSGRTGREGGGGKNNACSCKTGRHGRGKKTWVLTGERRGETMPGKKNQGSNRKGLLWDNNRGKGLKKGKSGKKAKHAEKKSREIRGKEGENRVLWNIEERKKKGGGAAGVPGPK